jgi:hypothetical protein
MKKIDFYKHSATLLTVRFVVLDDLFVDHQRIPRARRHYWLRLDSPVYF